ncbi:Stp1/IreP family PP2C-type Ser/Thr phosphatase [Anabaena sp. FACHB-1250]|uniref:Protein serine/threonine phosphatase n=2 Tax=Dolichospermum TaxID=748770 RepID=A0A480AF51_9CYAN|nr:MULTISPECIES: Stp1/IreP family PP2C-type Ser/Thr phosphatase [Nostocales]MBD2139927.1 Stp1/IreP family PP2C-type Ser/Thr phosphatase [Anabaena sp. FACHB-1250]MBD2267977.1 Stp1/IreP family PP2C-type Ser/Thr phosphatase [Anabaena sp. FACHB-1391]MBE9218725.1 Stp1/IreP family PP2C-type Ser/Thr phosphatase [Dolichospermum flos-aquae LEGE 04289]GCL42383.1 protein serine/threonine phosphatase [Dolichospermum planctonicum]
MKLDSTGLSDPGLIRAYNQDSYYIDPAGRFFIVADGMGGHAGGEEASRIATQEIRSYLEQNWQCPESASKLLQQALSTANQAIVQDQQNHPERADMGTTAVVVVIRPGESPVCGHVGDSRLYRLRKSQLQQITEDHTWIAKALKIGDITPDEARVHPYRHVLSSCLGREDLNQISVQQLDLEHGDRLLLCSDGLTEELVDDKIASYLQGTPSLEIAAESLVEAAKEEGGNDNITVVLVSVET